MVLPQTTRLELRRPAASHIPSLLFPPNGSPTISPIPHLVIVHIGHDEADYRSAHIPGARYLAMDKFADLPHSAGNGAASPRSTQEEP